MEKQDNTGLGLIKTTIERVQNEGSLFSSALKKLVNSTEEELDDFLKRKIEKQTNGILRLISGGQTLALKALDGDRLICKAETTFKSFLDEDFVKGGINKPGVATPETPVLVREIVSNSKFVDIFGSLPGTWNQKWVSQNQVIEFCEKLPDWLKQGGKATFFLIKKDENSAINENNPEDNLAVIRVRVLSDGLRVYVYRLGHRGVWIGEYRHRVVSPQLIPLAK